MGTAIERGRANEEELKKNEQEMQKKKSLRKAAEDLKKPKSRGRAINATNEEKKERPVTEEPRRRQESKESAKVPARGAPVASKRREASAPAEGGPIYLEDLATNVKVQAKPTLFRQAALKRLLEKTILDMDPRISASQQSTTRAY